MSQEHADRDQTVVEGGDSSRRDLLKATAALPAGTSTLEGSLGGLLGDEGSSRDRDETLEEMFEIVPGVPSPEGFGDWYAGDLHSHTQYSDDVCETPACEEPYTWGYSVGEQIRNAELRGLDYVALTDHNTVETHTDPEYGSELVTLLDGYEHSLSNGHGGIIGVDSYFEEPTGDLAGLSAMLEGVHDAGGLGIINHPRTDISSTWEYETPAPMDAVEVWSIAWYLRDELTQGTLSSNNHESLALYDAYLNAGYQLAAVGGSDSHWRATNLLQGVGQPTTWVNAADDTESSLVEGIREGQTFVSWDWLGPLVRLSAAGDDRSGAGIGETAPIAPSVDVETRIVNGVGHRARLVANGDIVAETTVDASPFTWETAVELSEHATDHEQGWIRAEVYLEDTFTMRALTSPVYFTPDGTPPTPDPDRLETSGDGSGSGAIRTDTDGGHCDCHSDELRRRVSERALPLGDGRPADAREFETIDELESAVRSVRDPL